MAKKTASTKGTSKKKEEQVNEAAQAKALESGNTSPELTEEVKEQPDPETQVQSEEADFPDYVKRMIVERDELKERTEKLSKFIATDPVHKNKQGYSKNLDLAQLKVMKKYLDILGNRLALAKQQ